MKIAYVVAVFMSLLGVGLLTFSVAEGEYISLLGIPLHARVAKGVGIVTILLGIIAFMVAYGGSLPPSQARRRG